MDQPVILCGLGLVGWRVLDYLRAAGLPVVAVDWKCSPDDPRLKGVTLVPGDCRQREVLERAGVATARGVLILTSDDLINISATLMVRHLNPAVRIVVRLFNQNLIPRLGQAVRNVFALSVSALTAPVIAVTALTGEALGTFGLHGSRRQVTDLAVGEHSPLRGQRIGEVARRHHVLVLAHLSAAGEKRFLLDVDAARPLHAGDHLVVCGEPRELNPLVAEEELFPVVRWAGWLRRHLRALQRTLREVDGLVKICTALLVAVILASTLLYRFGIMDERRSTADALYRTISVMATGADMHEEELRQPWQKVFVSFLRISGAALTAAFTAIVTNYLLRARLGGALEVRRIPDSGHVIVCGLGNVGFRVVEELYRLGERMVVIEQSRDSRFVATARRLGVAVILGDATVLEVLRQAHAASARAVIAATENELANLEIALLARELNPRQRVVVRLSDEHLAQTLREATNVGLALSIPALAAPAFMAALFGDRVQNVFLVGGRLLAVVELTNQPDDLFPSEPSIRALAIDYRLLPITLIRSGKSLPGDLLDGRLGPDDRLIAVVELADLERLLRRERVPGTWAVEVDTVPEAARPRLVELLCSRRELAADEALRRVQSLPGRLADCLTRGQAEDLAAALHRDQLAARICPMDGSA